MQHVFVWRLEDVIGAVVLGVLLVAVFLVVVVHLSKLLWEKLTDRRKPKHRRR